MRSSASNQSVQSPLDDSTVVTRGARLLFHAGLGISVLALLLLRTGVSLTELLAYCSYLAFALLVPGSLCWRAITRRPTSPGETIAGGLIVGLLLELLITLLLGDVGPASRWMLVAAIGCAAAMPCIRHAMADRDFPRAGTAKSGRVRMSSSIFLTTAWTVSLVLPAAWLIADVAPGNPIPIGSVDWYPRPDVTFHLALAEASSSVPPVVPWVVNEPLHYHWFTYAHLHSASAMSGVEVGTILLRLWFVPVVAATGALSGLAAVRASGGLAWAGPIGCLVATGLTYPLPLRWPDAWPLHITGLGDGLWYSPTQTYGMAVLAFTVLLLVRMVRRHGSLRLGEWILLLVSMAAMPGAKSVALPVLGAGVATGFLRCVIAGRTLRRTCLRLVIVGVVGLVAIGATAVLLYPGASHGLSLAPSWPGMRSEVLRSLTTHDMAGFRLPVPFMSAAFLILLVLPALPSLGLRVVGTSSCARRVVPDIVGWLLWGTVIGGCLAWIVSWQPGGSEVFFVRSTAPALGALCGWGVASGLEHCSLPRKRMTLGFCAVVALASGWSAWPLAELEAAVALQRLALAVLAVLTAAVLATAYGRSWRSASVGAAACVIAIAFGVTITGVVRSDTAPRGGGPGISRGLADSARWLQQHADTGGLVATNRHCRRLVEEQCEADQFTVAALSGRQVLVEGWAFTATANEVWEEVGGRSRSVPFWDEELLAVNDAAFNPHLSPGARQDAIVRLRERYDVRWLLIQRDGILAHPEPRASAVEPATFFAGLPEVELLVANEEAAIWEISRGSASADP